mgnify:FL=1|jgi:hypothetical protein
MTNYYENLDSILLMYRSNHVSCYNKGEYITACKWLYAMNCGHPSKAFIKDMPKFTIRSDSNVIAIRTRLSMNQKAQAYCDYWLDKLEIVMANFRETNQEQYNRV